MLCDEHKPPFSLSVPPSDQCRSAKISVPNLRRHRELTAPGRTLSLFESAELEDLEQQLGQQHLPLMPKSKSSAPSVPSVKSSGRPASDPIELPDKIERISATLIDPSPWNRKTFTEAGLAEMKLSIREHGITQPILLRPHPTEKGRYELVYGERRWRAATLLDSVYLVPARVAVLTDRQVLELQKIENLQREDLDPIEEAQGLQQMIADFGYTLDDLIATLGKQKSTIYARLKLAHLCPEGVKHFRAGHYAESVAIRIARIPLPDLQRKFLKHLEENFNFTPEEPLSDRDCAGEIEEHTMRQLKGSPFKTSDATLVPEKHEMPDKSHATHQSQPVRTFGGACDDCPMRAGNLPDFDPKAGRADMCLNPLCYRAKVDAAFRVQATKLTAAGGKVADPKQTFERWGGIKESSGLVPAEQNCYGIGGLPGQKKGTCCTYGQLAAHLKTPAVLVQRPGSGEILTLLDRPALLEAAKKAGLKMEQSHSHSETKWREEQKASQEKFRRAAELRRAQVTALVEAAGKPTVSDALNFTLLQHVTRILAQTAADDVCRLIASRRKLDLTKFKAKNHHAAGHRPAVAELGAKAATWPECRALLVDLLAINHYEYSQHPDPMKSFAEVLKVNLAAIARTHNESVQAKAKAKAAQKSAKISADQRSPKKPEAKLPKAVVALAMKHVRKAKAAAKK